MKVRCPMCAKEVSYSGNPYRPFCSDRCRTADLAAWAEEEYKIPGDKIKGTDFNKISQEE
ncbi:MAG: DNA gyrase inhibitor YacG [Nitrospirae bacterium]|nr:DNA gyrase inhibitor YacG [Nitrospirota bacterium]